MIEGLHICLEYQPGIIYVQELEVVEFVFDEKKQHKIAEWWPKPVVRPTANDPLARSEPGPSAG